jgi:hypothetical protein
MTKLNGLSYNIRLGWKVFLPSALINDFVSRGSVAIRVNDDTGHYFQIRKGLCQGDPLSAMLFNIVANILAISIECAKFDGPIEGWFHI